MKQIQEFIFKIKDLGITLNLQDEDLKIVAPKNVLTSEIINEIKRLKVEIIDFLKKSLSNNVYNSYTFLKSAAVKDFYPLSSAQKRLFFLQRMDLESIAYNIPYSIKLGDETTKGKVEDIFLNLILRHESFRTSFEIVEGIPVQKIHNNVNFNIEEFEIEKKDFDNFQDMFLKPFDLSKAPLLKVAIVKIKDQGKILMINVHHIISDGVSISILEKEFKQLYQGQDLEPLGLQYKDYSEWQNSQEQQIKRKEQEGYWLKQLQGDIPVLNLPEDYTRPVLQSFEGASASFPLSIKESNIIKTLAKHNDLSLYMSVLSVFGILIHKLTGQEDLIIGTPLAGREHPDLERIVGMFVNTLVIRILIKEDITFKEYVNSLKQTTLDAFDNQDYQFEDLIENLSINRDISRNPLFDVAFNLLNQIDFKGDITALDANDLNHNKGVSKFDLTLTAVDYGEQILLNFEYCTKLFKAETINRIITFFKQIILQIANNEEAEISEIEILNEEEKLGLLYDFNNTNTDYPHDKSIKLLIEEVCDKLPNKIALNFGEIQISYKELNKRSNQLANKIIKKGIQKGEVVALVVERSELLIISMLAILKAGAAYLPISGEWPSRRIKFMLSDTNCPLILLEDGLLKQQDSFGIETIDISKPIFDNKSTENLELFVEPLSIVYIIYTSGTTGEPKGVLTNNSNVSRIALNNNYLTINKNDILLQLSSYTFDGSVFDIYGALLNGANLVIIEKEKLLDVRLLLDTISKKQVTAFFLTTAFFNTIVDYGMDRLKDVRKILFGGELISKKHTDKALRKLGSERLVHVYGPTETTVFASYYNINQIDNGKDTIPIGKPVSNTSIYLLDKGQKLVPIGVVGEVYIGGKGNASGYINGVELTKQRFVNNPYIEGDVLYKTGDLGKMLPDGNIEFIGRIDHQVKIRGFRIELGEIENALLSLKNIKEAIVIASGENKDKFLVAYIVYNEDMNDKELRSYLATVLPDYMIPTYFIKMDVFPLNMNGKVNRKELPNPVIKDEDCYIAPSNILESELIYIWSEILNIPSKEISVTANFFYIGGHSLKAAELVAKIHKKINVEIPIREIFIYSNIRAQAERISISKKNKFESIPKAKKQDTYSVSSAQKRMYLLQQMDLDSVGYNMPYVISLKYETDKLRIKEVFKQLIARHESFRTSFESEETGIVQRIHEDVEFNLEEFNEEISNAETIRKDFIRAFDLNKAPLLRAGIIKMKDEGSLLLIDLHHIISDGVSQKILESEFQTLYSGNELPALNLQYKDFSEWQNSDEQQKKVKRQEKYWLQKFEGEIPKLNLPTDYSRPAIQSYEGATVVFTLNKTETQYIKKLGKENELTFYMSVLSIFNILLSRLCGQEDIIVGVPIANRNYAELENVVGMFVNTLALRNEVKGGDTLKEFLKKLKETTLEAYENQDYQFEDLVENLKMERDPSRNPLFNVVFNLLNMNEYSGDLSNFSNQENEHVTGVSKFDLTLTAADFGEEVLFNFEYSTNLFKAETIERFIKYFKHIVHQIGISDCKISSIEILPEEEKAMILNNFNNTRSDYYKETSIHKIFEEQVQKNDENIALVCGSKKLNYGELNRLSNQIAHYLIQKGVNTEAIVGIELESSCEFVVCMLGVLKAGGAYLPIDKNLPEKRKEYIIKNSKTRILLHNSRDYKSNDMNIELINYEDIEFTRFEVTNPNVQISITNLAYVIYTSGTSGNPKGTLLEHKGIVSENNFWKEDLEIISTDRCLQFANISFDASVWEICLCLLNGASLYIPEKLVKENISLFEEYLINNKITVATLPPVFAENIKDDSYKGLRLLITAGSDTNRNLIERFNKITRYINAYGPTETSICATFWEASDYNNTRKISIGKPIRNLEVYIFDSYNKLQGIGIPGELCISGDGLARGYLYLPELTAEKFISHPLKEGEKLYRTGDLAQWLPDGNIEFLGRIDSQVKIRGCRIELNEIENVILRNDNINECIVVPKEIRGNRVLCGYIVCNSEFNEESLRNYLVEFLPDYMIPSYFIRLDKMPLTSNGKINQKVLPLPEINVIEDYMPPSGIVEEKLVAIWSEVLNIPEKEISINANFFALGGHSMKASIVINKIQKEFCIKIPLTHIFTNPTVKTLAMIIKVSQKEVLSDYVELEF